MEQEKKDKVKEIVTGMFKEKFGDMHINNPQMIVDLLPNIYTRLALEKLLPDGMSQQAFYDMYVFKLQEAIMHSQFRGFGF